MAKIIIVDTDQASMASIREILASKAHALTFLSTSAELMDRLQKKQPDLIIIGVELEGSDGRELSRLLQTETVYKDIPVILTSPYYHTDSEIRSFYCDDLVSMPFDATRLATSVEVLLAKEQAKAARLEKV